MRRLPMWVVPAVLAAGCGLFGGGDGVITGSGRVTSEARPVAGVERVSLEGLGEVRLVQGAAESLTIEAEDNLLPLITSELQAGTLRLGFARADWRDTLRPTQPIRYTLTVRDLQAFDLSGSGSLQAASLSTERLRLNLTGQGDITVDQLQAGQLEVRLDGTGTVRLAGQVAGQSVGLSGSGQYAAGDLESQTARVALSGSGEVVVWARAELWISLSGSGSVSYWGDPAISRRDITGAGDINPMGVK